MLDCLPETIEPVGLAEAGRSFRGKVGVESLERLCPLLLDSKGSLQVQLDFQLDERCMRVLQGHIDGEIRLLCQRCLQALEFPLHLSFKLGIVTDEAGVDRLPEGYEPLLVSGVPLNTREVIEDEVLLAMPAIPVHSDEQACKSDYRNPPVAPRDNPFSVLEKLKTQ